MKLPSNFSFLWYFTFAFCGILLLLFVAFYFCFLWHFTFAFCGTLLLLFVVLYFAFCGTLLYRGEG